MLRPDLIKNEENFIASMEELIERYKKAIEYDISKLAYENASDMKCLLCNPLNTEENFYRYYLNFHSDYITPKPIYGSLFKNACANLGCPWIVILGVTCEERLASKAHLSNYKTDKIKRIVQLKQWIKIYKDYVNTQKEKS